MGIEGFITAIIVGAIVGALGRLVVPGKQSIGILLTILIGIVAALIGTFIMNAMGIQSFIIVLIVQVVLAAIGVALVAGARGRGRTTGSRV